MSKQLIGFLTPWQKSFEGIKASFDTLGNNLGDIGGQFSSIKESTEKIRADFCKNITSCAETTVGKLKTKGQRLNMIHTTPNFLTHSFFS